MEISKFDDSNSLIPLSISCFITETPFAIHSSIFVLFISTPYPSTFFDSVSSFNREPSPQPKSITLLFSGTQSFIIFDIFFVMMILKIFLLTLSTYRYEIKNCHAHDHLLKQYRMIEYYY